MPHDIDAGGGGSTEIFASRDLWTLPKEFLLILAIFGKACICAGDLF